MISSTSKEKLEKQKLALRKRRPAPLQFFRYYCAIWILAGLYVGWFGTFLNLEISFYDSFPKRGLADILSLSSNWLYFAAGVAALLLKPNPWTWVYQAAYIAIGCMLPFCAPFSIPLFFSWFSKDMKSYYGRIE